jgi:O-antigen/teichoic acid export membrane protein
LRSNAIANLSGRVVPGLLTVAAVPILVHLLGAEAYGVIGFFAVLQIMFTTLDQGLTTTATREVAAHRSKQSDASVSRTLVRSLEAVYWPVGIACGALIAGASGWLATNWLNTHELAPADVRAALIAGGVTIAARWPASLYRGVLDGLELQVVQNTIAVGAASVRILGGLAIVAFVEPSVVAFMVWQAIVSCAEVMAMGAAAWVALGGGLRRARVELAFLRGVWRYAAALNVMGVLGLVTAQVDRVVISYVLPLASLGYYSIALTSVALIPYAATAVSAAVLPRFAGAQAGSDSGAIRRTYRQATEVVSYIAVGVAFTLAFFPSQMLRAWVRSDVAVQEATVVLVLLALAYLLNALYAIPYTLTIATGHVRVPLIVNLVGAPLLIAAMIPAVHAWGLAGAAAAWLCLTSLFFFAYNVTVHRFVLHDGLRRVALSIARYVFLGVIVFGSFRLLAGALPTTAGNACLAASFVAYLVAGSALLPGDVALPRPRLAKLL